MLMLKFQEIGVRQPANQPVLLNSSFFSAQKLKTTQLKQLTVSKNNETKRDLISTIHFKEPKKILNQK